LFSSQSAHTRSGWGYGDERGRASSITSLPFFGESKNFH
jgi:hypothetical protein